MACVVRDSFDKRARLNSRQTVILGHRLNDVVSFTKLIEAGKAYKAYIRPRTLLRVAARRADRPVMQCAASAARFGIVELNWLGYTSGLTTTSWLARRVCCCGSATSYGRVSCHSLSSGRP